MNVRFGGHWLTFLWVVNAIHQLQDAVVKMKSAGAVVVELAWHALNQLSAKDTATALKNGGVTRAVQCVFIPNGKNGAPPPMGDPISDDSKLVELAQQNLRQTIAFIGDLKKENIAADMIDGPSCFVLGKENSLSWEARKERIIAFYLGVGKELVDAKIRVAIELLRPVEDRVIETREHWIDLIDSLNVAFAREFGHECINTFGAHYDTHHISERGWDQVGTITMLGRRIIFFHGNGTLRRPAGGEGDVIPWSDAIIALSAATEGRIITLIYEPFCELVRNECPELGDGLPEPVEEPGGMITTRATLARYGVKFVKA